MKVGQELNENPTAFRVVGRDYGVTHLSKIILSKIGAEIPNAEIAIARIGGTIGHYPRRNCIHVECENGEIVKGTCTRVGTDYEISIDERIV